MTTWRCPKCGHSEQQPAPVTEVVHLCGLGQRAVRLERQTPPDPKV